ncbi:unnamed protein product [Amoebophrya sp. A120]|nr:unnamed protein product [Amoebophrya sp. A120]|eukprot:GSA120T00024669001.1
MSKPRTPVRRVPDTPDEDHDSLPHDLPSSRLRLMYQNLPDLINTVEELQRENMRIRFKAVGQLDNLCKSWFISADNHTLKTVFEGWKDMWHKRLELKAVEEAITHTERMAVEKENASLEDQQTYHDRILEEYMNSHKAEIAAMMDAHKNDKEGFAAELEEKLRKEHKELLKMHFDSHVETLAFEKRQHEQELAQAKRMHDSGEDEMIARHKQKEKILTNLKNEVNMVNKKLGRVMGKVESMEASLASVQQAVHGFDHDVPAGGKSVAAQLGVEDLLPPGAGMGGEGDDEKEYITEALHEILGQVDPKYMSRSKIAGTK